MILIMIYLYYKIFIFVLKNHIREILNLKSLISILSDLIKKIRN